MNQVVVERGGGLGVCAAGQVFKSVLRNTSIVQTSIAASSVTALDIPPLVTDPASI